jgi:hypothetical protein
MRVVDLDSSLVLGKWPLDLVGDTSVNSKSIVSLPETNNGEISNRELEAVLLINKVENGAGNFDEDIFGGDRRSGRTGVFREEIFGDDWRS